MLLERGADANIQNNAGKTPFVLVKERESSYPTDDRYREIVTILEEQPAIQAQKTQQQQVQQTVREESDDQVYDNLRARASKVRPKPRPQP